VFLVRGDAGNGYWAGVVLPLQQGASQSRRPALLVLRSDSLGGAGMFFDLRPWLWGGLAVLTVSLVFWLPAVWRISRYLRKLTAAAESIAGGNFHVSLAPHSQDELGQLGRSVESMASRLDHLISGQKRFLGDAAHELCAPLARLRTGLSVAEARIQPDLQADWSALGQDASELADLVQEILRFSRTGRQQPNLQPTDLVPLLHHCASREGPQLRIAWDAPESATALADAGLLSRAVANIIRNVTRHAGDQANLQIRVLRGPGCWEIEYSDDGPGVAETDLPQLFEPFYRTDLSRSRETGGFGLGLAIVRASIESCGGSVSARKSHLGGLTIAMRLPAE
jgi:two-component system sensor histidine kinase CpxA